MQNLFDPNTLIIIFLNQLKIKIMQTKKINKLSKIFHDFLIIKFNKSLLIIFLIKTLFHQLSIEDIIIKLKLKK